MPLFCEPCCARIQQRWVLAVMGAMALVNAYTMRICLSVAITSMVKPTKKISNDTILYDVCPTYEFAFANSSSEGTYEWDEYTQGVILSSFYWGYMVTQIPGGILAEKFGGKYTLGIGIFSTAILTLLTPSIVRVYGVKGLVLLRFLMGLGEGPTLPAASVLVAQWAPFQERTKIGTMVMSGTVIGTVMGNALSGILIQHSSIGWPLVFYFFGALSVVWFVAWIFLCFDNPDVHPFITVKEKKYLHEATIRHADAQKQPTPWWRILTSVPLWALLAGKFGYTWGIQTLLADLPKYLSNVLKMSIQANGLASALPHVLMWTFGNVSSWLADWLIKSDKMSRTNVRKTLSTVASVLSAIFLIAASYAGCDRTLVVILFTVGVAMMGLFIPSIMVNPNDLSPTFCGTVMAIANVVAALVGTLAPYLAGLLTPNQALLEWRVVFWITVVVLCGSSLIFHAWADGEVQNWDEPAPRVRELKVVEHKDKVPFLENSTESGGTCSRQPELLEQ